MNNLIGKGSSFDKVWDGTPFTKKASVEAIPNMSPDEKERVFAALLQGPNGLKRVAFAMQQPLKNRLDYVAVGRKVLLVDELPQGELPVYDLDIPEFGAVKVAARGTAPVHQANIKRVEFPTFPISVDHTIKWEEIQIRRYPAFDRAKERVAISMAIAEDKEIFELLKAASDVSPNTPVSVASPLTRTVFADLYGTIAANQLIPGAFLMNPLRFSDILKWDSTDLDQVSLNVLLETGQYGVLYGTRLIVSTKLPSNVVYCVTTPDKLGRLPERKAVEIKIFDNIPQNQYDIVGWEIIGMGIHNTAGIVRYDVT